MKFFSFFRAIWITVLTHLHRKKIPQNVTPISVKFLQTIGNMLNAWFLHLWCHLILRENHTLQDGNHLQVCKSSNPDHVCLYFFKWFISTVYSITNNGEDDIICHYFYFYSGAVPDLPFFVPRTKNHMVPVYLNFEAVRDERKITIIKHIEGDIWVIVVLQYPKCQFFHR